MQADIHYAPTLDCLNDGSTSFWYDRNLNSTNDETTSDLVVTTRDLDLMEPADRDGDMVETIPEAIANRGHTLPTAP